jgi:hypothetical protein
MNKGQTMNYKTETFKRYFHNEELKAIQKQEKRKEIITNILEFLFTLLMFFCFWLLLVLVNI